MRHPLFILGLRMLNFSVKVILILASILGSSTGSFCQLNESDEKTIIDFMNDNNIPGLSIAISNSSGKVSSYTFGYSQAPGQNKKIDSLTLFQAASISKCLTAAGVLKLSENGSIVLDTPIQSYLSSWEFKPYKGRSENSPSIRQLLNHTGGINMHGFAGYKKYPVPTINEILNGKKNGAFTSKIKAKRTPGLRFDYSGGGYIILQRILMDVSQKDFSQFMQATVLTPCKMSSSFFGTPKDSAHLSYGHKKNGKLIKGGCRTHPELAAAGLWSTPTDLVLFLIEIQRSLDGKTPSLLTKESALDLTDFSELNSSEKIWYGLGFFLTTDAEISELIAFSHGGNNVGYTSFMQAHRKNGKAFAIMCNRDNADLSPIITLIQQKIDFKAVP